jgi:hypothetical protein
MAQDRADSASAMLVPKCFRGNSEHIGEVWKAVTRWHVGQFSRVALEVTAGLGSQRQQPRYQNDANDEDDRRKRRSDAHDDKGNDFFKELNLG